MGRLVAWLLGLWAPCKPREQRVDLPVPVKQEQPPTAEPVVPTVVPWRPPTVDPQPAIRPVYQRDDFYAVTVDQSGVFRW